MRVLAASLEQVVDTFLHAGYISAYPRTYYPHSYGMQTAKVELDLAEALRLKGEVLASSAGGLSDGAGLQVAAVSAGGGHSDPWLAAAVVAGCLLMAGAAWIFRREILRRVPGGLPSPPRMMPALALALLALVSVRCGGEEPLPEVAPWEGLALKQYENPDLATRALLHGLVADGIINVGQPVSKLANIQNEVGVPIATPTQGMLYALKTYGVDGWGREMRLERKGTATLVTSAGADGSFGTADDLSVSVVQATDSSWDNNRYAHFVRDSAGQPVLMIHRWTGGHFKYCAQDAARQLTGGELFDVVDASQLGSQGKTYLTSSFQAMAAKVKYKPILLQVF